MMIIKTTSFLNKQKILDIFKVIKQESKRKFIESIDVAINLFLINRNKLEYNLQGSVLLPNGVGRQRKIAVLTSEKNYDICYKSGAFVVGGEDLINKIKKGFINFDVLITTPEDIRLFTSIGQILGPKNLMPNLKLGTITNFLQESIKDFLDKKIIYKTDKFGIIHSTIGKVNFSVNYLLENFSALIKSIFSNKPVSVRNDVFIKKIVFSSTMGKSYVM